MPIMHYAVQDVQYHKSQGKNNITRHNAYYAGKVESA